MKLKRVTIHNIRSVKHADLSLEDYSIIIGANNAGKSNLVTALRLFYEDGKLSFSDDRDFPKFAVDDEESWVELAFLTTPEEQEQLREEYRTRDHILKVRRYFIATQNDRVKSGQLNIYAYEGGELSNNLFYGAKNVSQQKLGSIIYIPAISKTDDTLKLTGPSPFRDLVNMVMKQAVQKSASYAALSSAFEEFNRSFRDEADKDGLSIGSVVEEINSEISGWDVKFGIEINSIKPEDLVKNLLSQHMEDTALGGERVHANSYGHGLQRHLIYSLIRMSARYNSKTSGKAKDFNPEFSLLLFEEPEAFLHPSQQDILSHSLHELASTDEHQVLVTSHSPKFVSKQFRAISSIVNVRKTDGVSAAWQINEADIEQLLDENVGLHRRMCDHYGQAVVDEGKAQEEAIRYSLYLDSERSAMFFARQVVICEGASEKALIDLLVDTKWLDLKDRQIYFLNALGKYNIHRFMKLLDRLGIPHSVIYDGDQNRAIHAVVNQFVEESKTPTTIGIHCFDTDLEDFLGIDKPQNYRDDLKPISIVRHLMNGTIDMEKLAELRKVVDGIT